MPGNNDGMPPTPTRPRSPMAAYRARKDKERVKVTEKYSIIGFISSGTYGRVFKAKSRLVRDGREFAIKKFKPDKEGETVAQYSGISQSAVREMALCREVDHINVIRLEEVILDDKCIFMVFEYAEHDLLSIIHYHAHARSMTPIPVSTLRSIFYQLTRALTYMHQNWILHRDLKPANIMVTADGCVKVGDLGLARIFYKPLAPLYNGDKVVVTIWYRAPELLLGAKHYTPAMDMWALGCIFAELLALKPIFKGEEVKMDNKKTVPFQRGQMQKIIEILGTPTRTLLLSCPPNPAPQFLQRSDAREGDKWPSLNLHPEYTHLTSFKQYSNNLKKWYTDNNGRSAAGFDLLSKLFEYDPNKRITATEALQHEFFYEDGGWSENVFEGQNVEYPSRKVTEQERDIVRTGSGRVGAESVKRGMATGHGGGGGDAKRAKTGA